jgi:hypothetical protein
VLLDEFESQQGRRAGKMSATDIEGVKVDHPRRHLHRRVALIAVALVMGAGTGIWATRSEPPGHRLVYSKSLPDGRVFQCFSDGAFIGSAGSEVEGHEAPQGAEGSEGGPALVVRPPDYTEDEARRANEEYRNSGRTPDQDLADFDRLSAECRRRR